ncbi:fimbria/pilus outer membrane usher protein [Yersinia intermedia]|uniref:fimbria/pilus outer membrane usher protein n=1 Tax=Yersinia intermedia TaxID=631 RepID=UPI001F53643F|nr:fimbria/pilus outer membrane usher protein [Yersinia intermedia]UNK24184.1 fimbrial biogenesis outer membrane usher protein [Yersinia intermedia]
MKRYSYNSKNHHLLLLNKKELRYLPLSLLISVALASGGWGNMARAEDYFNPYSLDKRGMQSIADIDSLSVFSQSTGQLPGKYPVDVYINNDFIGLNEINFIADDRNQLVPELTRGQLIEWGVNSDSSPALSALSDDTNIISLGNYIPDATAKFEFAQQKLFINIPQVAMKTTARGYISPESWDQGVPALTLSYGFTGSKTWHNDQEDQHAEFLSLRSGLNMGAWRLRNYSVYSQSENHHQWENIHTYMERDIAFLRSQLTLGETNSSGDIFDSFQFNGVRLASDENMLPYSLRGFAPVIRGIAQSNAKVTVRQNGFVIYQTYVPAGPFEINDLYPTSVSGNLDVTVTELDGSEQTFVTPFSSVPIMQRDGQFKYSLSTGKYRANTPGTKEPGFIQSTLIYGLPWNMTLYGGGLYSEKYNAIALGSGLNLGEMGAFSVDVTNSRTNFDVNNQSQYNGQSYRFQYAKSLLTSGTTVTLAGYRYSTEGYYDFSEANDYYHPQTRANKRSRMQANISQTLAGYGSVYLNGYQQDFWARSGKERTINAGYNTNWGSVTYGFNYTYNDMPGNQKSDQIFAFNLSLPLDVFSPNNRINSNMSTDNRGNSDMQLGLSGHAMENAMSYSVQQSYGNRGQHGSGNAALSYKGRNGTVNSGYGYSAHSQRLNYGLQGGMVLHSEGLTLAQSLGETLAIVQAPGADNVAIQNASGVTTDEKGYAIVSYLTPYQRNRVQLDVESLGDHVELANSSMNVVPTRGAVVRADFKTHIGWRALVKLKLNEGVVPFGATVTLIESGKSDSTEVNSGIVGDNGEVYLSGLPEKGRVLVQWGKQSGQQCDADFLLPQNKEASVLQIISSCTVR